MSSPPRRCSPSARAATTGRRRATRSRTRAALSGEPSESILNVGFAPDGLAHSAGDRLLFVNAYLSRELVVHDVSDLRTHPGPVARLPIVETEPLPPQVLRGKQLFNDSFDTRIARDGYIGCAHCHLEGLSDHRTWDFPDRGEGLRNTISLFGRAGTGHGPIHWSADFDEVQDFEHEIPGPFAGTGPMDEADFHCGTRDPTLGDPEAGVSEDLDALDACVESPGSFLPSPHRDEDGTLTEAAERGRALFESSALGCTTCHAGAALTDSRFETRASPCSTRSAPPAPARGSASVGRSRASTRPPCTACGTRPRTCTTDPRRRSGTS